MRRDGRSIGAGLLAALLVTGGVGVTRPARADDAAEKQKLKEAYERLQKELESQKARLDALEGSNGNGNGDGDHDEAGADEPPPPPPPPPVEGGEAPAEGAGPATAEGEAAPSGGEAPAAGEGEAKPAEPAPAEQEQEDTALTRVLTKLGSFVEVYGFLRLDMVYDDSRANDEQTIAFVAPEPPDPNKSDFALYPRLTRLGLNFGWPDPIEPLMGAKVTGKLEVDFQNGGSESREILRIRHAYLKLSWGDFLSVLAGQTWDTASPLFPSVNTDFLQWGAGNVGDRRPQLRVSLTPKVGDIGLIAEGSIGLTGAINNRDFDNDNFLDGVQSGRPNLQMHLAVQVPLFGDQKLQLGFWGYRAWQRTEAPIGGRRWFSSTAFGGELAIPLYADILAVRGEVFWGYNLDDIRGGILQGVNPNTGERIRSWGFWAELDVKPMDWLKLYVGYSMDDPSNNDVQPGGRTRNQVAFIGTELWFEPVAIGLEFLHWETGYTGADEGDLNRIKAFIAYKF